MEFRIKPAIGEWYRSPEGMEFEVVAIDQDEGTVEIQYFDGAIEELDFASWGQMSLETMNPPEDWSGSVDMMREDFMADMGMSSQEDWTNPLDVLDTLAVDEY